MELPRQDPDQLLHAIRNDASTKKSGKLKIFFGYAAGVGKPSHLRPKSTARSTSISS